MKWDVKLRRILRILNHWIIFFLLTAFAITCCIMLFSSTLSGTLNIDFTAENISSAAKRTFVNVILISLLFTAIDSLRRYFFTQRPVQKIIDAAQKIAQGDFTIRLEPLRYHLDGNGLNQIIDCINQMAEELSGTETLRTDFVANVSHELKTPLAVMQNYSTMLQNPNLAEEERNLYAKSITDACRRLSHLITNILKLNKLENQQFFSSAAQYDLSEQLCEDLLQFESVWEEKQIEIDTQIEEDVWIKADVELLSLVWNNLLSNAFKFTEPGGTVSVSLTSNETHAIVCVSDTGCGISREVGQHIFEKFYQGDSSHATQGNGLGLALVKRVVDIVGGDISVESEIGHGTSFTVTLKRN